LIRDYRFSFKDFEYDEKGNLIHENPKKSIKFEVKEKYGFKDLLKIEKFGVSKANKLSGNFSLLKYLN